MVAEDCKKSKATFFDEKIGGFAWENTELMLEYK